MLRTLYIENLAVVKKAEITFTEGLNVFSGETGAGKSVVIGGLDAALGKRVNRDMVRTGEKKALVTAVFDCDNVEIEKLLSSFGFEAESELLLTREITFDGKSSARINGKPAAISMMSEIGSKLCDIHGQSDNRLLTDENEHIKLLDDFAGNKELLQDYQSLFDELKAAAKRLAAFTEKLEEEKGNLSSHLELREKITKHRVKPGEDEEIDYLFEKLENAEELRSAAMGAVLALSSDEDGFKGALKLIYEAGKAIGHYSDKTLAGIFDELSDLSSELKTIITELSGYADGISLDEERLSEIRARKEIIDDIKKRFGGVENSLTYALERAEQSEKILSQIEDAEVETKRLTDERDRLLLSVTELAKALSKKRSDAALKMAEALRCELSELDMKDVRIEFNMTQGKLTKSGMDKASLLFSPNPGEELRPLSKIASGGELSRLMLAIKSTSSSADEAITMVFDEIDTGVSGRAAAKIGRKLRNLSEKSDKSQAIAITHLAQIAVFAKNHILIEKKVAEGRTYTEIEAVTGEARIREIARIQVGDNITELALKNAEEQLLAVGL
ncbi:MAG: DNA repair protein RecN [Ruminococcus sp.]|jgi:DNA repair protein RecN (Recombination protein N)|nr:DNA repair protein RecN [Ruminococcus sp.]